MRKSAETEIVLTFSIIESEFLLLYREISEFRRINVMLTITTIPVIVLMKIISLNRIKTMKINAGRINVRYRIRTSWLIMFFVNWRGVSDIFHIKAIVNVSERKVVKIELFASKFLKNIAKTKINIKSKTIFTLKMLVFLRMSVSGKSMKTSEITTNPSGKRTDDVEKSIIISANKMPLPKIKKPFKRLERTFLDIPGTRVNMSR